MTARSALTRLAATLVAGSLLLTGCSGGSSGSGGESSTAEGAAATECQSVSTELQEIGDELSSLQDKVPGDLPGAVASVESAISRLGRLSDTVTDPELRAKISAVTDALNEVQQQADNAASDPLGSAGDLLDAVASARTAYDDLKGYCGIS